MRVRVRVSVCVRESAIACECVCVRESASACECVRERERTRCSSSVEVKLSRTRLTFLVVSFSRLFPQQSENWSWEPFFK